MFTKFDFVDSETFKELSLPETPPPMNKMDVRQKYSDTIMKSICPQTLGLLKKESEAFAPYTCFFSGVTTEFNDGGEVVPLMKRIKGQVKYDLDYTLNEYKFLIYSLMGAEND